MADVVGLIDGFNVYHALDSRSKHVGYRYHKYKWLDYWKLCDCFTPSSDTLKAVHLFTAYTAWKGKRGDSKRARHEKLIQANKDHGVAVEWGYFRPVTRTCKLEIPKAAIQYDTYEEKRTDVAMAVTLVALAHQHAYDRLLLVTADSDLIPAINEAKRVHASGEIINIVPIERRAIALKNVVDLQMRMRVRHLKASRLPNQVLLSTGKSIECPPAWLP